jgi:protein tyrosine/serine phosphatase
MGKIMFTLALGVALLASGWAGFIQLTRNFHVVKENQLYRSAQMDGSELATVLQRYRIKTVINLRGRSPQSPWYNDELAATTKHGVDQIDIRMSALREPSAATLQELMNVFRTAQRPILIHCSGGSDRTGLAAALFLLKVDNQPPNVAARQLSLLYGHFPWFGHETVAMDRTFWRVAESK